MARSATLDMTQGSLSRQIIGFSLPLMFTNLLQMLFSMVDLAVVGRFSSSAAMGSVGSTTTLIFLFTGFLMGLGSGVNVLVATHFGARSEKNVRESIHTSFLVCLIAGVTGADQFTYLLWTASPFWLIVVCVGKAVLCGLCAGLVAKALRHRQTISCILAALTAPVVNTGVFAIGMLTVFKPVL